jgi:hypothetical protein
MALPGLEKAPFSAIFSSLTRAAGTGFLVGQAVQRDIPDVRLESLLNEFALFEAEIGGRKSAHNTAIYCRFFHSVLFVRCRHLSD